MILTLHPDTPQVRHLERITELLRRDGVIAYPTDTLFGLGCLAFASATAAGVLFAKLMNVFAKDKVNPLIGAAGFEE